jgi:hypothetical protein
MSAIKEINRHNACVGRGIPGVRHGASPLTMNRSADILVGFRLAKGGTLELEK